MAPAQGFESTKNTGSALDVSSHIAGASFHQFGRQLLAEDVDQRGNKFGDHEPETGRFSVIAKLALSRGVDCPRRDI
jgi:hypothetical protein